MSYIFFSRNSVIIAVFTVWILMIPRAMKSTSIDRFSTRDKEYRFIWIVEPTAFALIYNNAN